MHIVYANIIYVLFKRILLCEWENESFDSVDDSVSLFACSSAWRMFINSLVRYY